MPQSAQAPAAGTVVVSVAGVTKRYAGVTALSGVDFDIRHGEVHALVGENGAGKSTLMKVLAGAITPEEGRIYLGGETPVVFDAPRAALEAGICAVYQDPSVLPNLTVAENIVLGVEPRAGALLKRPEQNAIAADALATIGLESIDPNTPTSALNRSNQQLVEIARAIVRRSSVILLDEPTASLTPKEAAFLFSVIRRLTERGVSFLYVSHRSEEILAISDRVTVLADGALITTKDRAGLTHDMLVSLMVGDRTAARDESVPAQRVTRIVDSAADAGPVDRERALELRGLTKAGVFHDISLTVHSGEIVAMAGLVGSGRTEVMRAVFGADPFDSGEVVVHGKAVRFSSPRAALRAGVAYVPEDRRHQGLVLTMDVESNIGLATIERRSPGGLIRPKDEAAIARQYIGSFSIKTPGLTTNVATLSGGNQQKVLLARALATDPRVLILDEPTAAVDLPTKHEFHQLLRDLAATGLAILVISSDLEEVLTAVDRILVMHQGRLVGELDAMDASEEAVLAMAVGGARHGTRTDEGDDAP